MLTAVYLIVTVIHLAFTLFETRLYLRNRSIYSLLVAATMAGLFYDNLIIGIGAFIGEGSFLQALNAGRFVIHALVTPTLIMFAYMVVHRLKFSWAQGRTAFALFGALTLLMIAIGVYVDIIQLSLTAVEELGTLRYSYAETAGPPIPAIVTIVVMIVVGAFVWRKHKWPILCIGSILMFILAGAGVSIVVLSNIGEVIFAGAVLWTDYKLDELVEKIE